MYRRINEIYVNSLKDMKRILPLFFVAILISTIIDFFVSAELVYSVLGANLLVAIPLATIIGMVLPIPRYATYPIAFTLYLKGAPLSVVFTLISGEVILGAPDRDVMEFKFFGARSYILRFVLCTVFVILGGYLMEVIL